VADALYGRAKKHSAEELTEVALHR
jgi:hypothetical protein